MTGTWNSRGASRDQGLDSSGHLFWWGLLPVEKRSGASELSHLFAWLVVN